MILTRDLKKSFGARPVLTGLDLAVEPGALTLMVGSNGAGKTTTLRLLAGLAEPDAGMIALAGHDLRRDRAAAMAQLSFLPQAPRFHPRVTCIQTVEFYAQLRGLSRRAAAPALDAWGLAEFQRVPTGKLSGGLRQRLALAIFALPEAPILMLDEPGLSLDPAWRQRLQQHLHREARRGCTVLVATHLVREWDGRADRCVLVEDGRVQRDLPPGRLGDFFPADAASDRVPADLQSCA